MARTSPGPTWPYIQTESGPLPRELRRHSECHVYHRPCCRRHATGTGRSYPGQSLSVRGSRGDHAAPQGRRPRGSSIARMQQAHLADFTGFQIEFDNYGSTHSPENRAFCAEIWQALRRDGLVSEKEVEQLYDPVAGTFLADRFVKGTCPKCKTPDQYGDSCVKCDCALRRHRTDRPQEHALRGDARDPPGQAPLREHRAAARVPRSSGPSRAGPCSRRSPITSRATSSTNRSAIGTSRGRPPISVSRFPTAPATTGTSGSTPPSVTSPRRSSGAIGTASSSTTGGGAPRPRSTTSSARTLPTSIRSSGPPC